MKCNVLSTSPFERKLKALKKKYKSLISDLEPVIKELESTPRLGEFIGFDCFKIRVAITSKGKGKRGGARLITLVKINRNNVYLLDIYDKSSQESISIQELKFLIALLGQDPQ